MKKSKRSAGAGLYRDGKMLVIREGARFPDRCAICNKAADVEAVDFTFRREKAKYIEVAAIQAVANAAADLVRGAKYTGPVQAEISLCAWHRGRRLRLLGIGVAMTVLGAGVIAVQMARGVEIVPPGELGFLNIVLYNFVAVAVALTGVVIILATVFDSSKLWFKATKYNDRLVWVSGARRAFLADLPKMDSHALIPATDDSGRPPAAGGSRRPPAGNNSRLSAEELIRRANLDDD